MRIIPLRTVIAYGTAVTVSVTIGGALWFDRSGAAARRVKLDDYIMVYQSLLEKSMATEVGTDPNDFPLPVDIRTNYARAWDDDPSGRTYISYSTNGTAVTNTYLVRTGDDAEYIVTNCFGGHTYKIDLPDTGFVEASGDLGGRYIWNAYSNITVSGFTTNINGTYNFSIRARSVDLAATYPGIWTLLSPWNEYRNLDVLVYVYTNTSIFTLLDFGPLETIGWLPEYDDLRSCVIADMSEDPGYQAVAFTYRQDSPFHGPWFTADDELETNAVVTGSVFVTNLVRDAICRWYVNKQVGFYDYGHSWESNTPAYYDPKYYVPDYHGIGPDVSSNHIGRIQSHIFSELAASWGGSGYIVTNDAVAGEFVSFTNRSQFFALSQAYTPTGLCAWAGVDYAYTNSGRPTTGDVCRLAKLLQEFNWTRQAGEAGALWWAHGYIGGDTNTIYTNVFFGAGDSIVSWAEAKSAAEADLKPFVYSLHAQPFAVTWGEYYKNGGGGESWHAVIETTHADLCYVGACTSMTASADFYVYGASPYVNDGPGAITQGAQSYATFDDNGSGVVFAEYKRVGTVETASTNPVPFITLGMGQTVPTWCDDPATLYAADDVMYTTYRGYRLKGSGGTNEAEIIMKWDWTYNTDPL